MPDFTNNTIDIAHLPRFEDVKLNPLSDKYWKVVLINIIISLLFLLAAITVVLYFNVQLRKQLPIILIAFLTFAIVLVLIYRIGIKRRGFAVRERDIIYASGVLALSTTIVPFTRIQHIALHEGFISRMFHLGDLQIFTAGGSSGSLHIRGIEIEEAKSIKALLMRQINAADLIETQSSEESQDE